MMHAWRLIPATVLAIVGATIQAEAFAQSPPAPVLSFTPIGHEETVYSYSNDKCADDDVPDAAARAFRDAKGNVHLIAAAANNRAMVGPDFNHLRNNCQVIYSAPLDPDPSHFDDQGWLESFYTTNGNDVYALVSMDYHPDRHNIRCGKSDATKGSCWYAAITLVKSSDGGFRFSEGRDVESRFVAGPSRPFSPDITTTAGALVPSNIVKFNGAYYVLVSVASDPPQQSGECLLRATELKDAKSWKGWDGDGFNVSFIRPNKDSMDRKQSQCKPLADIHHAPVRSLSVVRNGFVIVEMDSGNKDHKSAAIAQTSSDLIHWTAPVQVMEIPVYTPGGGTKGQHGYYYPSLIDQDSKSLSFEAVGSSAYLYLTQYTYGAGRNRNIVRYPLRVEQK